MILWLLLGLLLAPTLFALLSRLIARRGNHRGAALVAVAGFAGCIACVVALRWLPLGTEALGPLQILVPSTDIVIAQESFLDPPAASATSSDQASNAGELRPSIFAFRASATARPEPTAAPPATATPAATSIPEPTATPARRWRREPILEPTVVPEPVAESEPEPAAEPVRYVVEPGDTLRGIAALYDIESAELQQYNGLSDAEADSLQIGLVLFIPPN